MSEKLTLLNPVMLKSTRLADGVPKSQSTILKLAFGLRTVLVEGVGSSVLTCRSF